MYVKCKSGVKFQLSLERVLGVQVVSNFAQGSRVERQQRQMHTCACVPKIAAVKPVESNVENGLMSNYLVEAARNTWNSWIAESVNLGLIRKLLHRLLYVFGKSDLVAGFIKY